MEGFVIPPTTMLTLWPAGIEAAKFSPQVRVVEFVMPQLPTVALAVVSVTWEFASVSTLV